MASIRKLHVQMFGSRPTRVLKICGSLAVALPLLLASVSCSSQRGRGGTPTSLVGSDDVAMPIRTPTPRPPPPSTPTPRPPTGPEAPVGSDDVVWTAVADWVNGSVSPVLRPGTLPTGLITVAADIEPGDKQEHKLFRVQISGPGKKLVIEAAGSGVAFNPPPPRDPLPGARGPDVMVRGHSGWLQEDRLPGSSSSVPIHAVWLMWYEKGEIRPSPAMVAGEDHTEYLLYAEGLTTDEVIAVAEGLKPFP